LALLNTFVGKAAKQYIRNEEDKKGKVDESEDVEENMRQSVEPPEQKVIDGIHPVPVLFTDTFRWFLVNGEKLGSDRSLSEVSQEQIIVAWDATTNPMSKETHNKDADCSSKDSNTSYPSLHDSSEKKSLPRENDEGMVVDDPESTLIQDDSGSNLDVADVPLDDGVSSEDEEESNLDVVDVPLDEGVSLEEGEERKPPSPSELKDQELPSGTTGGLVY